MTIQRPLPFILIATLLGACSAGGGSAGGGGAPPTSADLDGRTFLSTSIEGRDLVPESRVRIAFTRDSLSATAGCNMMGGAFRLEDGRLIADALAMTEMACQEPLMAQDAWLGGLLGDATADLAGSTLILQGGGVRLVLGDE